MIRTARDDTLTPLSDITTDASQINGFREGVYDYVYLGTFDENPIKWKVLANHRNSGEADGLFVLAYQSGNHRGTDFISLY